MNEDAEMEKFERSRRGKEELPISLINYIDSILYRSLARNACKKPLGLSPPSLSVVPEEQETKYMKAEKERIHPHHPLYLHKYSSAAIIHHFYFH